MLASSTTWSHLHARSPHVFHEFRIAGVRPPELSIFATTPFSPVVVRSLALSLSAGFAGIAGALYALTVQVVTLDTLGLPQSTSGMLHAYIGGHTAFFGPVIGAVFITVVVALTDAWPLYLGIFFVTVIISMLHGLSGSLVDLRNDALCAFREGRGIRFACQFALRLGGFCIGSVGLVSAVEMVNALSENRGDLVTFILPFKYPLSLDPHRAAHWIIAAVLVGASWKILRLNRRTIASVVFFS